MFWAFGLLLVVALVVLFFETVVNYTCLAVYRAVAWWHITGKESGMRDKLIGVLQGVAVAAAIGAATFWFWWHFIRVVIENP